jgi:predicted TIM-barrel fold metal-dependent hydrolase
VGAGRRAQAVSIENGAEWVPYLLDKLAKALGQMPSAFAEDPVETFRRHVWVAPYYEDDIRALADRIGAGRVLFGSDFPHAEGLADPTRFVDDLPDFPPDELRQVMRDNARALVAPA